MYGSITGVCESACSVANLIHNCAEHVSVLCITVSPQLMRLVRRSFYVTCEPRSLEVMADAPLWLAARVHQLEIDNAAVERSDSPSTAAAHRHTLRREKATYTTHEG